jgi:hypothetical protein
MNNKQTQLIADAYNYRIQRAKEVILNSTIDDALEMLTGMKESKFEPNATIAQIIKSFYQAEYDREIKPASPLFQPVTLPKPTGPQSTILKGMLEQSKNNKA